MGQENKRNYDEVLGIERDADASKIKTAYRQEARKYHLDKNPGDPKAEALFKEASEACAVLSDPAKRAPSGVAASRRAKGWSGRIGIDRGRGIGQSSCVLKGLGFLAVRAR